MCSADLTDKASTYMTYTTHPLMLWPVGLNIASMYFRSRLSPIPFFLQHQSVSSSSSFVLTSVFRLCVPFVFLVRTKIDLIYFRTQLPGISSTVQ